jgi:hypothetical protein
LDFSAKFDPVAVEILDGGLLGIQVPSVLVHLRTKSSNEGPLRDPEVGFSQPIIL